MAATGFARGVDHYRTGRPGYPAEMVELLVDLGVTAGSSAADIAAGTGLFTRCLVETGADIGAVEPVAEMRAQLQSDLPEVFVVDGVAEDLPLPDADLDALTVATAFHWFDAERAMSECARVLWPGGLLVLVWNGRDESVGWVSQFTNLLVSSAGGRPYVHHYDVDWIDFLQTQSRFCDVGHVQFANPVPSSAELLVARAASTSYIGSMDETQRGQVLDAVSTLATTHPDLAGREHFDFPHITRAFWARRRAN